MQFRAVVGQESLKQKLINTVKDGRIGHAQLFVGAAGYGGLQLALAYAQYICCKQRADQDSCGVCPSCIKYQKNIHPDLHFVFPVNSTKSITADKKPISDHFLTEWRSILIDKVYFTEQDWYEHIGIENKQGNISANEAERILTKLNLKSFESDYKVMLIWLPERLNGTSANRLLKLIEEPPENTLFLFVSEHEELILKTIYSRTQRIKLGPIDESAILQSLTHLQQYPQKSIETAAHLSEGNYLKALQTLAKVEHKSIYFEYFVNLMRLAFRNDVLGLLDWAEEMSSIGRERQKSFCIYAQSLLRENFMLNQKIDKAVYLGFEEFDWAQKFSAFITPQNVIPIYTLLNDCIPQIVQNGNAKIIFTDFSLKIKDQIKSN